MKSSDVPEKPILQFLFQMKGRWCVWYSGFDNSITQAFPKDTPEKIVIAKMRQLIKRGKVKGCPCGCRGDYEITEKGEQLLRNNLIKS